MHFYKDPAAISIFESATNNNTKQLTAKQSAYIPRPRAEAVLRLVEAPGLSMKSVSRASAGSLSLRTPLLMMPTPECSQLVYRIVTEVVRW